MFTIPVLITNFLQVQPRALLDCGALNNLIDYDFLDKLGLPSTRLMRPLNTRAWDGTPGTAIQEQVELTLLVGQGFAPYTSTFLVAKLAFADLFLGLPFFEEVNPRLDWRVREIYPEQNGIQISALEIDNEDSAADLSLIPKEYLDYSDVFDKASADQLPDRREFDHQIPLVNDARTTAGPIYKLSPCEHKVLEQYVKENLDRGFIRRSESSMGSPILFVKKPDGSLRLCVDYR